MRLPASARASRRACACVPPRPAARARLARLLTDRVFLGYVLVIALMFSGYFAFISGSSFALITLLGVSPTVYGVCFGAMALGLMAGNFLSVQLTVRFGIDPMIR